MLEREVGEAYRLEREVGEAYRLEREAIEVVVIFFLLSMLDSEVKLRCLDNCSNSAYRWFYSLFIGLLYRVAV